MLDALLAALVVAVIVAAGLALLYAVTVVPFLLAVDLAERRGRSTGPWAGWSLLAVLLALVLVLLALRAGVRGVLALLPLALAFAPAAVLALRSDRLGPPAGRHESPV